MGEINKISLIGLGSIGSTYASMLHDMNPSLLRVITNNERYDRYTAKGFVVNGKSYHFNYIKPEEEVEPADLIIVAVKFHHLQQAIEDIKKHVGPNTT
ncbi:MAG: ketopantoate reductase family protein, partial [Clostridia bacterium]|nr:ketopantoate reductase family protein [Clostridia bacterium]